MSSMSINVKGRNRDYSIQDIKAVQDYLWARKQGHAYQQKTIDSSEFIKDLALELLGDILNNLQQKYVITSDSVSKDVLSSILESGQAFIQTRVLKIEEVYNKGH